MAESSFDIVAEIDINEVGNAHSFALKQITNRYDFKGKTCELKFDKGEKTIIADGSDDYIVEQMMDIFTTQLAKRGVNLKALSESGKEAAPSGGVRKTFVLRDSLKSDECKQITKALKASKLKAKANVQGDMVRITGKSRDELQAVQDMVKELDLDAPVKFTNYKTK